MDRRPCSTRKSAPVWSQRLGLRRAKSAHDPARRLCWCCDTRDPVPYSGGFDQTLLCNAALQQRSMCQIPGLPTVVPQLGGQPLQYLAVKRAGGSLHQFPKSATSLQQSIRPCDAHRLSRTPLLRAVLRTTGHPPAHRSTTAWQHRYSQTALCPRNRSSSPSPILSNHTAIPPPPIILILISSRTDRNAAQGHHSDPIGPQPCGSKEPPSKCSPHSSPRPDCRGTCQQMRSAG